MKKQRKREDNPYSIEINLLPTDIEKQKYCNVNYKFPENLVPNAIGKFCEPHENKYCSPQSAINRYLVISDKVHIHDILPVDDSRNTVCRAFYLDTATDESDNPPCDCRLPYTGEADLLLPVSTFGNKYTWTGRKTFNVVSYRLLFDFLMLEITDGSSASGYITAFNRRRSMLCGQGYKECSKKVWLQAVCDFQKALHTNEVEAFSCSKCPSETSVGDGLDEVHIGDGVSEGMPVDLVPADVKAYKKVPNSKEVKGIEHKERTLLRQPRM